MVLHPRGCGRVARRRIHRHKDPRSSTTLPGVPSHTHETRQKHAPGLGKKCLTGRVMTVGSAASDVEAAFVGVEADPEPAPARTTRQHKTPGHHSSSTGSVWSTLIHPLLTRHIWDSEVSSGNENGHSSESAVPF